MCILDKSHQGYFLFSRYDWSIFVTQLVARHMKEIIYTKLSALITLYGNVVSNNCELINNCSISDLAILS
jgi:hypothetical protein